MLTSGANFSKTDHNLKIAELAYRPIIETYNYYVDHISYQTTRKTWAYVGG
jgi:hypothetical protein